MTSQLDIFEGGARQTVPEFLEGFRYRPELITPDDEASLLARVRSLPFREFEFHGHTGRRAARGLLRLALRLLRPPSPKG